MNRIYSVRQDNNAPRRVRAASLQAYPVKEVARKRQLTTKSDRSKKHSTKRQTVVAVGWIKQPISEEIDRIAAESGASRSHTIAELLEEAVHQKLHQQHAAMIRPIIRDVLVKEGDQDRKRMAELLVQNTVLTRQIMYLVTNVFTHIGATNPPTAERLHQILDWSKEKARENTFTHSEETEALIAAVGAWLDKEQGGGEGK